jgi:hypothetical protein
VLLRRAPSRLLLTGICFVLALPVSSASRRARPRCFAFLLRSPRAFDGGISDSLPIPDSNRISVLPAPPLSRAKSARQGRSSDQSGCPSNARMRCLIDIPAGPSRVVDSAHFVTGARRMRCSIGFRITVTQNSVIGPGASVIISPCRNSATPGRRLHREIPRPPRRHGQGILGPDTRRGSEKYPSA